MSVTAGRRLGARAACARAPAPAVADAVNQAQARSASGVPAASRKLRRAGALLPASRAGERVTDFAVQNHVDQLCKTAPGLCAHRGNAGDRVAGPRP